VFWAYSSHRRGGALIVLGDAVVVGGSVEDVVAKGARREQVAQGSYPDLGGGRLVENGFNARASRATGSGL
jgi:hypothetical protein